MAIEYIEVRGSNRDIIGIVDDAVSIIWHTVWFGVGDFEIYAKLTAANKTYLSIGRYVTRPNSDDIGIIEKINVTNSITDGRMIVATGRFAKSILDRRLIYRLSGHSNKATVITGNVESAARALVVNNAINCTWDTNRNFPQLELGANSGTTPIIVDENGNAASKQVSYQNLLEYTDGLLEEYGLSARVILDNDTNKLQYVVRAGTDRSADRTDGYDPVIFSKDYDNLSDTDYSYDTTEQKNVALIGGEGEDISRFYSIIAPSTAAALNRRETWVDAASINKKYKDENEQEQEYTDAEYDKLLITQGRQQLATMVDVESFTGTIIVTDGNFILNEDFKLGDIVTVQENSLDKYINVRIIEVTEVQDANGYTIDAVYQ